MDRKKEAEEAGRATALVNFSRREIGHGEAAASPRLSRDIVVRFPPSPGGGRRASPDERVRAICSAPSFTGRTKRAESDVLTSALWRSAAHRSIVRADRNAREGGGPLSPEECFRSHARARDEGGGRGDVNC